MGKKAVQLAMAALKCFALVHPLNLKIRLWGGLGNGALGRLSTWRSVTCTQALCRLSQEPFSLFCYGCAGAVFLLPPPDCERYLKGFKGISTL